MREVVLHRHVLHSLVLTIFVQQSLGLCRPVLKQICTVGLPTSETIVNQMLLMNRAFIISIRNEVVTRLCFHRCL